MNHFDVHLIRVIHVLVPEDDPEPEEKATELAATEFIDFLRQGGITDMVEHPIDFWATDSRDVYAAGVPCQYCGEH